MHDDYDEWMMMKGRRSVLNLVLLVVVLCLSHVCSVNSESDEECTDRREALVISHGKEIAVEGPNSPFEKKQTSLETGNYYVIEESKPVLYIPNFLNTSIAQELKSFCQDRFVPSPVRAKLSKDDDNDDDVVRNSAIRTSESCALVPAYTYLTNPRFQEMRLDDTSNNPLVAQVIRQVDVAWEVSQRAASLLHWDATTVEPLQIVRYTSPDAFYKVHHDHGNFYGKEEEHHPWTVLVFLNTVNHGGFTHFPKLDLKVKPRAGDAIAWSNVLTDGKKADPDMVHAGEPPGDHGVEKYAVNIWFGESTLAANTASSRGQWGTPQEQTSQ